MSNVLVDNAILEAQNKVFRAELDWGATHLFVISELENLAELYLGIGANELAKPIYWRILDIQLKLFGSIYPGNARALYSLGEIHETENELKLAEQFYTEALWLLENCTTLENDFKGLVLLKVYGIHKSLGSSQKARLIENKYRDYLLSKQNKTAAPAKLCLEAA